MNEANDLHGDVRRELPCRASEQRPCNRRAADQHSPLVKEKRRNYEIYVSKLVWEEAAEGDKVAVKRRLKFIAHLPWLQVTAAVAGLARALIKQKALPPNAANDASYIAVGAVYHMQVLLTWNFSHINNPATEELVRDVCSEHDYHCPVICTPDQLLTS